MNEILKETKTNVIEKQILINQITIMNCLKFNNVMFGETLNECIEMSVKCLKAIDKYDSVLQGKDDVQG